MYILARLRPPVCIWLLILSARDATLATPRPNDRRRRILAILPSMLARPASGSYAIVDALDLGAPTASTGNAGAHPSLRLGGRRPSRGALRASRRNGRGVVSPKTGRRVNGVQQRVGKPRVIVVQGGQVGSQAAAAGCVSGSVSGGEVGSDQIRSSGWRGWSHGLCMCSRRDERQSSSGPGPGARATGRQSLARRTRRSLGRCWTGSRNLELAPTSSWVGCAWVAALLRHDRAESNSDRVAQSTT